jgi:hypothetical protein
MKHLVDGLVSLFEAESCVVNLLQQGQVATSSSATDRGPAGSGQRGLAATPQTEAVIEHLLGSKSSIILPATQSQAEDVGSQGPAMLSPIVVGDTVLGVVIAVRPAKERPFDGEDLHLLDTVTLYLGQAIHARRLRDLLDSRLLHLALTTDLERTLKEIRVGSVPALDKMTRIVAKSFFREMSKAGFGSHQIIRAATEIISELHRHLQKRSTQMDEFCSDCTFP